MSDIEGKAATGSSERVWETNEFQSKNFTEGIEDKVVLVAEFTGNRRVTFGGVALSVCPS